MRSLALIVEDEVDAADVLSLMFEHWGYDTVIGNDGFEGYHLAISMLPDLVLADYAMPGLNGAELAKKLAENTATASIPFILMSAKYEFINVPAGLSAVLKKPFELEYLRNVVEGLRTPPRIHQSTCHLFSNDLSQRSDDEDKTPIKA